MDLELHHVRRSAAASSPRFRRTERLQAARHLRDQANRCLKAAEVALSPASALRLRALAAVQTRKQAAELELLYSCKNQTINGSAMREATRSTPETASPGITTAI